MERKIGETFEFEGRKFEVKAASCGCDGCFFDTKCLSKNMELSGECEGSDRYDRKDVIFVEVQERRYEQPQKLNLCEILKDCPKGEEFWSPLLGNVKLSEVNQLTNAVFVTATNLTTWRINHDATITINGGSSKEIMLYPSREQRDWAKVKYEPRKERFDPKTLKPFDKVLSRYDGGCWSANLFSHIEERDNEYCAPFSVCNGSLVKFCIPYNDDTKHLVGTTDEAPEFYRYWED